MRVSLLTHIAHTSPFRDKPSVEEKYGTMAVVSVYLFPPLFRLAVLKYLV
jgi:hypothetical protein